MPANRWNLRTVDPRLIVHYRGLGLWGDETLGRALFDAVERCSEQPFWVWSADRPYFGTVGQVADQARRLATSMRASGVEPGDVVVWQLPNWRESAVAMWASLSIGAVVAPVADGYGCEDVTRILRESDARLYIAPTSFRGRDYIGEVRQYRSELPGLLDAWSAESLDDRIVDKRIPVQECQPDEPCMVCYTSGSSSMPKGVIHTHRSILAEIRQQLCEPFPASRNRELVASPVGHIGGLLRMLLLPVFRSNPVFAVDRWQPERILEIARRHDLVTGSGVIFFLQSLLDEPTFSRKDVIHVRHVGTGGAPIPDAVAARADDLGITLVRTYGSSEHPTITTTSHEDSRERRLFTDGRPRTGVEVMITDFDDVRLAAGCEGRIWSRGPDLFAGYVDPSHNTVFSPDGWFETGDLGVLDSEGFLRITGRTKDIIIRGGENVSASQVERHLLSLEVIAEAVVIAAPDERLGERVCAFVRLHPGGGPLDLGTVRQHLHAAGVGRHFVPAELHVVDHIVRNSSGKADKRALRTLIDDTSSRL